MVTNLSKQSDNGKKDLKLPPRVQVGPEGMFTSQKMSSAIDKFVERGDNPEDLTMRSDFPSYQHGVAWCYLLNLSKKRKSTTMEKMLTDYLAMLPAINAKRIKDLKDAVIGAHSQESKTFGSKFMQMVGLNKNTGSSNG